MRVILVAAIALLLPGISYAQVLPGDLLLNSFSIPDLLVHYRVDGTVVRTSGLGTGGYWMGAAILPDGNWVATRQLPINGVNIFDGVTGAEIASWDTPGFSGAPADVGAFSDGTLAVVDQGGKVWRFDTAGIVISSWNVSAHPTGILVDDQDHVWTCDYGSGELWHTDDQGNKINSFTAGSSIVDVTMAQDGTLFISRYKIGEVAHYAQDGSFLGAFPAVGSYFAGIAMGKDQTLWVTAEFEAQLFNYDQVGTLLGSFNIGPATHPLFLTIPLSSDDDIGTNYCGPANLNSTGQSAVISAFGSTFASKKFVTLTASQLPLNVFGYFLNSDVQDFKPFPPGSNGNLCLGGGIGRHVKQVANSGAAGELVIKVDLTALPRPNGTHSVVAGETWNFQCWFRDTVGGMTTSNFTDGIEILFQ